MEVLTQERAVLGESPLWHRSEGIFYWVDIDRQLVFAYDPDTERSEQVHTGLTVTALGEVEGGGLVLVTSDALLSLRDGQIDTLAPLSLSVEVRTNDGKVDPNGRVWFGTMALDKTRPIGGLFVFDGGTIRPVMGPGHPVQWSWLESGRRGLLSHRHHPPPDLSPRLRPR